jgi:hypothetical protein
VVVNEPDSTVSFIEEDEMLLQKDISQNQKTDSVNFINCEIASLRINASQKVVSGHNVKGDAF